MVPALRPIGYSAETEEYRRRSRRNRHVIRELRMVKYLQMERHPGPSGMNEKEEKHVKQESRKAIRIVAGILGLVLVAVLVLSSVYVTTEDQFAVVTTLGNPSVVSRSGIHFKIPFIQQKTIISKNIRGVSIGYHEGTNATIEAESVMITVDYNFVDVDFYLEWRVTDPVKYLYASDDPESILKMISQSYIRDTIGLYGVDAVITTGTSEIQAAIKEKISERMVQEDLGVALVNITIQDAEPPTAEVQNAFKAVETAKQGAETATNNAEQYYNEKIPAAKAEADEIVRKAEAYRQARINDATAQADKFNELYLEYARYPEITRQRLFYETLGDILPDIKVMIIPDGSSIDTYMAVDGASVPASALSKGGAQ